MNQFVCQIVKLGEMHVSVWLHTAVDPTAEEWSGQFDAIDAYRAREAVPVERFRLFVVSDGASPGVKERNRMAKGLACKSAVVTTVLTNPIAR